MSALRLLGDRLGRHTLAYSSRGAIALGFGLVNVVVLTRFLGVSEFGELALLFVLAAGVTIVSSVPVVQGAFAWVFGGGGEEGGDDVVDGAVRDSAPPASTDERRALTTALALTALSGGLGAAAVALAAEPLADVLLGSADRADAVRLAGIAGGVGAVWRLVSNVPRLERRPGRFLALALVRPVAVLGAMVPLVVAGGGVEGAVTGIAVGSAAAIAVGLALTRGSYAPRVGWRDARGVLGSGGLYVPILLSLWAIQNLDLYLVWLLGSDADAGRYRVASRIGAGMGYFVSAFMAAWMPLMRTGLGRAAIRAHGSDGLGAILLSSFTAVAAWIALGLALFAWELIAIAPPAYAEAAPLIPLIGVASVAYGLLLLIHRSSRHPRKLALYVGALVTGGLAFVPLGLLLVSRFGAYGAPLAQLTVLGLVTAAVLAAAQRSEHPLPIEWRRLASLVALAGACLAAARGLGSLVPDARLAADLAAVLAYPLLAATLGAIPRGYVTALRERLSSHDGVLRTGSAEWLVAGLAELDPGDRRLLELVARGRPSPEVLAAHADDEVDRVLRRTVAALRTVGGFGAQTPQDEAIAAQLLSRSAVAERDRRHRGLWAAGADPLDIAGAELVLARLRRLPERAWSEAPRPRPAAPPGRAPLLVLAEARPKEVDVVEREQPPPEQPAPVPAVEPPPPRRLPAIPSRHRDRQARLPPPRWDPPPLATVCDLASRPLAEAAVAALGRAGISIRHVSLRRLPLAWWRARARPGRVVLARGSLALVVALFAAPPSRRPPLVYDATGRRRSTRWRAVEAVLARHADVVVARDSDHARRLRRRCRLEALPLDAGGNGGGALFDVCNRLAYARPAAVRATARRARRGPRSAAARRLTAEGSLVDALARARADGDRAAVRRIAGELRVLDPAWRPAPVRGFRPRPIRSRVLHLLESSLPHAPAGYGHRSATLCASQQRCGMLPTVATRLGFPASRGIAFAPVEYVDGIPLHRFWIRRLRHYTAVPRDRQLDLYAEQVGGVAAGVRPRLLWAATPHLNGLVALALREQLRVPLVYDVRGFPDLTWLSEDGRSPDDAGAAAHARRLRAAELRCMREADAVVTLSETMRAEIVARGVPADHVRVLPHAVEANGALGAAAGAGLRERIGLNGGVVVGHVSTLRRYEGVDVLLRAVALARGEGADVGCLIVGDGPARRDLERLARRLDLDGAAVFTGRLPAAAAREHYAAADVLAVPRLAFPVCERVTPLKVVEAMAAGSCVVGSALPALEEATAGAARLVPAGDPEALASAIVALAEDPAERERLGGLAAASAARNTPDRLDEAMAELLSDLGVGPR